MAETKIDRFVSTEPGIEVDAEAYRILKERIKSSDEGHLITAEAAKERFRQWLSNSSTMKTR